MNAFVKNSVLKHFGKKFLSKRLVEQARAYEKEIMAAKKVAQSKIFNILKPQIKRWVGSVFIMMFSETLLSSFTYAYSLSLPYRLTKVLDGNTMRRAGVECLMMVFVYMLTFPLWIYGTAEQCTPPGLPTHPPVAQPLAYARTDGHSHRQPQTQPQTRRTRHARARVIAHTRAREE